MYTLGEEGDVHVFLSFFPPRAVNRKSVTPVNTSLSEGFNDIYNSHELSFSPFCLWTPNAPAHLVRRGCGFLLFQYPLLAVCCAALAAHVFAVQEVVRRALEHAEQRLNRAVARGMRVKTRSTAGTYEPGFVAILKILL